MSLRWRTWQRWVGYPLFALAAFVFCLKFAFPYGRLRDMIEGQTLLGGRARIHQVGRVGPRLWGGVKAEGVLIRFSPPAPSRSRLAFQGGAAGAVEEKAARKAPRLIRLDEVTLNAGVLAMLLGDINLSFSAKGLGGRLKGSYSREGKTAQALRLQLRGIQAKRIPLLQGLGPPLAGRLGADLQFDREGKGWATASGELEIQCSRCVFGDGKSKLEFSENALSKGGPLFAWLATGVTPPRMRLGKIGGRAKLDKGVLDLGGLSGKGPDAELQLEGSLRLRDPLRLSMIDGYLRFRVDPEAKQRDPVLELLENGVSAGRRSDGFVGLKISGMLAKPRVQPSKGGGQPIGG